MVKVFLYVSILILLFGCKKAPPFLPIAGKWSVSTVCYSIGLGTSGYIFTYPTIETKLTEMEISKDHLYFRSSDGIAKFRIISWESEDVKVYYTPGDTQFDKPYIPQTPTGIPLFNRFVLKIKDIKNQQFVFSYYSDPSDNSTLYGDYWIKGQIASSTTAINVGGYGYYTYNPNGPKYLIPKPYEQLMEYKLIN